MDQHPLAKGISAAGNEARFDDETRHQLALKMIQHTRLPQVIPEGFNSLLASSADLRPYGIPPRLNKETHPLYHTKWEDVLSRPLGVIVSTLTTKRKPIRPPHRSNPNKKIVHPNASGWPWSGAVHPIPQANYLTPYLLHGLSQMYSHRLRHEIMPPTISG